ncbi:type III-A CRISPR-associated RAMP protein Csm5 [Gallibacterium anatis]|uniref:type III-A CRISPR-associated RAMP protein Csm5 n=1 Tax=Gallibacterium anatis TaxID=750 RepID=UPI0039FDB136
MKNKFFSNHKLYLTPISPIHIGCGEEFEPINYVIDNDVLYNFNIYKLSSILTEKDRQLLFDISSYGEDGLISYHNFLKDKKELLKKIATYQTKVCPAMSDEFAAKLGRAVQSEFRGKNKEGSKVFNKLIIERSSYLPFQNNLYIPGSSVKGAIVTSILDSLSKKEDIRLRDNDLKQKYVGSFENSFFSLVKLSDFMPTGQDISSYVYYIVNKKKKQSTESTNMDAKGPTVRRECISFGQYRAFYGELSLWDDEKVIEGKPVNLSFLELCKIINKFYSDRFKEEFLLLKELDMLDNDWKNYVITLLKKILEKMNEGKILLIRLGRNTGAEAKSYRKDGFAKIEINTRKKSNVKNKSASEATTVWLSAEEQKSNDKLIPLGWALIEIDPIENDSSIQEWVSKQPVK